MIDSLIASFGECKYAHNCVCAIKTFYELVPLPEFYIHDEPGDNPVNILENEGDAQLHVKNNLSCGIHLIKADHCLFTEETRKCDCILFNDETLYFVEIKTAKAGQRANKRKEAIPQLAATIEKFIESNIDVSTYDLYAIICFKHHSPYPVQASKKSEEALFFQKYKARLKEGSQIEFPAKDRQ